MRTSIIYFLQVPPKARFFFYELWNLEKLLSDFEY